MSENTCVCEDTGQQSIDGCCPVHGGDACLLDVSQMRGIISKLVHAEMWRDRSEDELSKASMTYRQRKRRIPPQGCVKCAFNDLRWDEARWEWFCNRCDPKERKK